MSFKILEIAPDTYQITDFGFVSLYLLVGSQRSAMIDSGFGVLNLNEFISNLVRNDVLLVNTHIHPDHSNGNRYFSKTGIGAIEWQNHGLKWNKSTVNIPHSWNPAAFFEMEFLKAQLSENFSAQSYNHWVGLGIPEPDFFLSEGECIDLGNRSLQVWHTPSHTTGSLCFFEPELRFLFVGDVLSLKAQWMLHLKSRASSVEIFSTFRKLGEFSSEVGYIFPAHGQKKIEGRFLAEIAEKMTWVESGKLRGKIFEHQYGQALRFDFGGYGPLMGMELEKL